MYSSMNLAIRNVNCFVSYSIHAPLPNCLGKKGETALAICRDMSSDFPGKDIFKWRVELKVLMRVECGDKRRLRSFNDD